MGTLVEERKSYNRTTPKIKARLWVKWPEFEIKQAHCDVFMGYTLCSHCCSLHPHL